MRDEEVLGVEPDDLVGYAYSEVGGPPENRALPALGVVQPGVRGQSSAALLLAGAVQWRALPRPYPPGLHFLVAGVPSLNQRADEAYR